MSEDGVAVVKQLFAAFNRDEVEAVVDAFDPDCELYEPQEMPDTPPGGYRGHGGIRDWMANLRETGGVTFEPVQVTAEGDVVFSEWVGRGTGQTSGVPIQWPTWAVAEIRRDKVLRLGAYLQEDQAREAARAAQSRSQPK